MVASTFIPGRNTRPLVWSIRIFTGMRCTTLTKLPVAFSGGSRLKRLPVAPEMESTWPETERPYMSTWIPARCPGRTAANCEAVKWAAPHRFAGAHAIPRGHQGGVAELQFGRRQVGARALDTGRGSAAFGAAHVHLLAIGLGRLHLGLGQADARLRG